MAWYNFWRKPIVDSIVFKSQWRNNMWVMTEYGIGILFSNNNMATIHLVSPKTGETLSIINAPYGAFRQAKFDEIPECRKVGLTKERAELMGYS